MCKFLHLPFILHKSQIHFAFSECIWGSSNAEPLHCQLSLLYSMNYTQEFTFFEKILLLLFRSANVFLETESKRKESCINSLKQTWILHQSCPLSLLFYSVLFRADCGAVQINWRRTAPAQHFQLYLLPLLEQIAYRLLHRAPI